jgi:predicted Rossmann fold nucleotide-binding protein DprA/Smf involved in DNA uptake
MALLLLILLAGALIFLLYYELLWRGIERKRGKNLVELTRDFIFSDQVPQYQGVMSKNNPWSDKKYRIVVEMHRRGQLKLEDLARHIGISAKEAEQCLDELESEGKVQQAGDAERGVFYRVTNEA